MLCETVNEKSKCIGGFDERSVSLKALEIKDIINYVLFYQEYVQLIMSLVNLVELNTFYVKQTNE